MARDAIRTAVSAFDPRIAIAGATAASPLLGAAVGGVAGTVSGVKSLGNAITSGWKKGTDIISKAQTLTTMAVERTNESLKNIHKTLSEMLNFDQVRERSEKAEDKKNRLLSIEERREKQKGKPPKDGDGEKGEGFFARLKGGAGSFFSGIISRGKSLMSFLSFFFNKWLIGGLLSFFVGKKLFDALPDETKKQITDAVKGFVSKVSNRAVKGVKSILSTTLGDIVNIFSGRGTSDDSEEGTATADGTSGGSWWKNLTFADLGIAGMAGIAFGKVGVIAYLGGAFLKSTFKSMPFLGDGIANMEKYIGGPGTKLALGFGALGALKLFGIGAKSLTVAGLTLLGGGSLIAGMGMVIALAGIGMGIGYMLKYFEKEMDPASALDKALKNATDDTQRQLLLRSALQSNPELMENIAINKRNFRGGTEGPKYNRLYNEMVKQGYYLGGPPISELSSDDMFENRQLDALLMMSGARANAKRIADFGKNLRRPSFEELALGGGMVGTFGSFGPQSAEFIRGRILTGQNMSQITQNMKELQDMTKLVIANMGGAANDSPTSIATSVNNIKVDPKNIPSDRYANLYHRKIQYGIFDTAP